MDEQPLDQLVAAMVRQDGARSQYEATAQVLEFLGKVDDWMQAGINPLSQFVAEFDLPEDLILPLIFQH